ncbi:YicC/YloC family endoribonuclease [Thermoanaerobacterium thermosaccharolyticum]|uniref:YicC/YloC family endoribonuclease n=1 Tax=Thermoanaerobacterium thermosaccharolyticum TaxID=1517 RepID=UPI0017866A5C|nr:YicC/YloC family endoribonuclease [Thermoanaerobacterium thermosaccharolyticum]MBE0068328.1 YicC family protein [Thermoanaerobacterium thermosaccharolyticum]MBE0228192.1 YicC family protein [Thermoanaerobacterium thermosaccharolyticum]
MIKSMTGYGRGEVCENGFRICVEIKTLNHRFLDVSLKLPKPISGLEDKLRSKIADSIKRGRVEINVSLETCEKSLDVLKLNNDLLEQYINILKIVKDKFSLSDNIKVSDILSLAGIIEVKNADIDIDSVWTILEKALSLGIKNLIDMRVSEGIKLKDDIMNRLDTLSIIINKIESRGPIVIKEYKKKLETRIKELTGDYFDQNRFLTEVAIMAERTSIAEEITRFKSHISQFRNSLDSDTPIGKKLDFLAQEMNREANTIGSKSMDLEIVNGVIELKDQIEKIREQVQNIE